MKTLRIVTALIPIGIISCSTTVPDAAPGINQLEMDALVSTYYWQPDFSVPTYDRSSLAALMDRSINPELDGAKAEGHSSSLVLALAYTGDGFFASVLITRSVAVRNAVEHFISSAWTYNKLAYPETQAIYK